MAVLAHARSLAAWAPCIQHTAGSCAQKKKSGAPGFRHQNVPPHRRFHIVFQPAQELNAPLCRTSRGSRKAGSFLLSSSKKVLIS